MTLRHSRRRRGGLADEPRFGNGVVFVRYTVRS